MRVSRHGRLAGVLDLRAGRSEAELFGGCGSGHAFVSGRNW